VLAAASLVHPNIVTAFDADQIGDRCFLIMEYVDGPNLDQLVQEQGPLPVDRACDFVRQVAEGLQCAFGIGMVHRDIKPANLLLKCDTADALVKISDFGLARLHEQVRHGSKVPPTIMVKINTIVGTPDYLSPEQSRSIHKADIRSDLYSLGCTFYYLLTGQVPFPGGTSFEKLIRHCTEKPVPVEELRPEVPPGVGDIVRILLAKDPRQRFQTPAELAFALTPYAVRGPFRRQTPSVVEPLPESAPHLDLTDPDESSALAGTMPPAGSLTPLSAADALLPPRKDMARRPAPRRWSRTLCWAAGIGSALVAIGTAAGLLLYG
jgi:serine/threonine-protein kinase